MGGEFGENGYMYMYGWVPSPFTWNCHDIVNWLYSNTKCWKKSVAWAYNISFSGDKEPSWAHLGESFPVLGWMCTLFSAHACVLYWEKTGSFACSTRRVHTDHLPAMGWDMPTTGDWPTLLNLVLLCLFSRWISIIPSSACVSSLSWQHQLWTLQWVDIQDCCP